MADDADDRAGKRTVRGRYRGVRRDTSGPVERARTGFLPLLAAGLTGTVLTVAVAQALQQSTPSWQEVRPIGSEALAQNDPLPSGSPFTTPSASAAPSAGVLPGPQASRRPSPSATPSQSSPSPSLSPSPLPPVRETVRYEAEAAAISLGSVESNHDGFSGGGFVDYSNAAGSNVLWTVSAQAPGQVRLVFRFANGTATNRPMDIAVNGVTVESGLSFAGTGGWSFWQIQTVSVTLVAGQNTVRATAVTGNGGPNIDYLELQPAG